MDILTVALAVFVITYLLISLNGIPRLRIGRGTAAAIGGLLMVVFGIVTVNDAFDAIDTDVIFLLIGMMMLAAGLELSGFFSTISEFLICRSETKIKLLVMVMCVCALLSAIALNDAVVLIFTPIVIKCCRRINVNPIPYLIGVMFSANIGSLATAVGNPQNAYIVSHANISFIEFTMYTLPISLLCLPIAFIFLYIVFRKELKGPVEASPCVIEPINTMQRNIMLIITVATFASFIFSGYLRIPIHFIAMIAGSLSLLLVASKDINNVRSMANRINWPILVFFIGLFVLMAGVVSSGLLEEIASFFPGSDGEWSIFGLTMLSALLSNLVSNVPAVVLIGGIIPNDMSLWITLAVSSTLAGNATLIGSAANIIVAERSECLGIEFNFLRFAAVGVPMTILTLIISSFALNIIF